MINTRRLGDIGKTLCEKFRKDEKRVQQWVEKKRAGLEASDSKNRSVLEELIWVEKLLREAIEEGKGHFQQIEGPPEGHTFYETPKRKARKRP